MGSQKGQTQLNNKDISGGGGRVLESGCSCDAHGLEPQLPGVAPLHTSCHRHLQSRCGPRCLCTGPWADASVQPFPTKNVFGRTSSEACSCGSLWAHMKLSTKEQGVRHYFTAQSLFDFPWIVNGLCGWKYFINAGVSGYKKDEIYQWLEEIL